MNIEASTKKNKITKLKTYTHYYLHAYCSPARFQVWAFCHQGPPDYSHLQRRVRFHLSWLSVRVWSCCGQTYFQRKRKSRPLGWDELRFDRRPGNAACPAGFRHFSGNSGCIWGRIWVDTCKETNLHISISRYNDLYIVSLKHD